MGRVGLRVWPVPSPRCPSSLGVAVVVVAVAVTGCSPSSGPPAATPDPPSAGSESASEVAGAPAPEAPSEAPASEGSWDPAAWVPTVRVTPVVFSEAERDRERAERLAKLAEDSGIDSPPEVELVRWTTTQSEYGEARATCLQEAGFPAVHDGFGGTFYEPGVPEAQDQALALAGYVCEAQYSPDPALRQDWSEEQLGVIYDYWDQYYIPCMAAHGVTISTADQPSRATYIAAFHSADRVSWWPSNFFFGLSPDEQARLKAVCPPYPPADVFYGS